MSARTEPPRRSGTKPATMADLTAALPEQAREAWAAGRAWEMPRTFHTPQRVVVLGMGGSAIGADVVATLAARTSTVPVQVLRGYDAPVTDDDTLVVAYSFSGKTEETLVAFQETLDGPGMRLAITTGGPLKRLAQQHACPLFNYDWHGPPRTAFAYGLFPLLAILQRLDAIELEEQEVERSFAGLNAAAEQWGESAPQRSNLARRLASRLSGRVPVIIGTDFLDVAARRWAADINENAKQWAFHAALPESHHNVIAGLGSPAAARDLLHVVLLDSTAAQTRNRLRVRITAQLLGDAGIEYDEVPAGGDGLLDSLLRACYLGDWVSLHLALLNGVDPAPLEVIETVKTTLAEQD